MEVENIIIKKINDQRVYFSTGQTKDAGFRLTQLHKLKEVVLRYQTKIENALWNDLHKSPEEAYLTEIAIVITEINNHIKHLRRWAKPRKVSTPIFLLPSSGKVIYEPLGVTLIIAPWNYPFQLLINPLIGSISAGCCAVLKPSPDTPTMASIIEEMIAEIFDPGYITVVQGRRDVNTLLLAQRFDLIFFTGSPMLGKVVMKAASENLTPVVLELGGKSPCIVDSDANIRIASRRIVWGKLINAGQTCIAPDYLLVHESVKSRLLEQMVIHIKEMYGEDIKQSRFYPRIVSERAMTRLAGLLREGTIYSGGEIDMENRFIAPTIIDNVKPEHPIMQQEIFGPLLPVLTFEDVRDAVEYINRNEKPLAFYYFGKSKKAKEILVSTTSGGACINDTLMHVTNHNLPFGGVGKSGTGRYHGKESFLAFSNKRAVFSSPARVDLPLKYVPFRYFKLIKRIM